MYFRRKDSAFEHITNLVLDRGVFHVLFLLLLQVNVSPDTVGDSRKVSLAIARFGKHVPDSVIPQGSIDNWVNVKLKFHIPTLLSKGRDEAHR
jgi:hypothetical protein